MLRLGSLLGISPPSRPSQLDCASYMRPITSVGAPITRRWRERWFRILHALTPRRSLDPFALFLLHIHTVINGCQPFPLREKVAGEA